VAKHIQQLDGVIIRFAGDSGDGIERAKNMFALGLLSWLYSRPVESTIAFPRIQVHGQAGCRSAPRNLPESSRM
jgi:Pyruvate/2-oxoacid:ferredoxin oxidoreductase gamma subunit